MTTEKQTKKEKKNSDLLQETITDIKEVQKVVKSTIDQGSKSMEQVHKTISKLPLKYLGKIKRIKDQTKIVGAIQKKAIGYFYDMVRTVNNNMFDVSKDILGLVSNK
jgi:hypothetical protein